MMNLSNIGFNTSWLVFVLPAMMLAGFAQMRINSAFGKYSKVPSNTGYTGKKIITRYKKLPTIKPIEILYTSSLFPTGKYIKKIIDKVKII